MISSSNTSTNSVQKDVTGVIESSGGSRPYVKTYSSGNGDIRLDIEQSAYIKLSYCNSESLDKKCSNPGDGSGDYQYHKGDLVPSACKCCYWWTYYSVGYMGHGYCWPYSPQYTEYVSVLTLSVDEDFYRVGDSFNLSVEGKPSYANVEVVSVEGVINNGSFNFTAKEKGVSVISCRRVADGNYNAVRTVIQIPIRGKSQVLTFSSSKEFIVGVIQTIEIVSSSGLTDFIVTSVQDNIQIVGMSILILKVGVYQLDIVQLGNDEYDEANLSVSLVCGIDNFNPVLVEIISGGSEGYVGILEIILLEFILLMKLLIVTKAMRGFYR